MDVLLRQVTFSEKRKVYQDVELNVAKLTVGASLDCLISLRGSEINKYHAQICIVNGQLKLQCLHKAKIRVNGGLVKDQALSVGDVLELERHKLIVITPPAGFDFALELYVDQEAQRAYFESSFVTTLSDTGVSKRLLSYVVALAMLILFLVLPLYSYFTRAVLPEAPTNQFTRNIHKTDGFDTMWSSGPILSAHYLQIGDDCSVCHVNAFEQVKSNSCLVCHTDLEAHLSQAMFDSMSMGHNAAHALNELNEDCQSCHKEHNEPESIVITTNTLCVSCHDQTWERSKHDIQIAEAFSRNAHPEFKLDFLELSQENGEQWQRKSYPISEGHKENSNLKFSHEVHLDASKVFYPEDQSALECKSCHVLGADNEHFNPLRMEEHCRACHDLKFDVSDPVLELPHGSPELIIKTLEAHFIKKLSDPNAVIVEQSRRRRPGRDGDSKTCTQSPFECGLERAAQEAEVQFTQRGCVTCHVVSDQQSAQVDQRFKVLPVKVNSDWYSSGTFNHKRHLTQIGQSQSEVCLSCHKADVSTLSEDVLIPGINNCLDCHDDAEPDNNVALPCIACHQFHYNARHHSPVPINMDDIGVAL